MQRCTGRQQGRGRSLPYNVIAVNAGECFESSCHPRTNNGAQDIVAQEPVEPQSPPRKIVHLQYIAWPDYHIPETPESVLTFMDIADGAQNDADAELRHAMGRGRSPAAGPMVVHCSAGVGRTGAFIVIDAALDVLRRSRRRQKTGRAAMMLRQSQSQRPGRATSLPLARRLALPCLVQPMVLQKLRWHLFPLRLVNAFLAHRDAASSASCHLQAWILTLAAITAGWGVTSVRLLLCFVHAQARMAA